MRVPYDFHIHSCLSPCADDDMTPANIAGMAYLKGLRLVALTDHNTAGNCRAFFAACEGFSLTPLAGMELTTAEDIHLVCLFETCAAAEQLERDLIACSPAMKNRSDIFGNQIYMNEADEVSGQEERFLLGASGFSLNEAARRVRALGGLCYPAHVDREANGILAILGDIPPEAGFTAAEFRDAANIEPYRARYASLQSLALLTSSDAHTLGAVKDPEPALELDEVSFGALCNLLKNNNKKR